MLLKRLHDHLHADPLTVLRRHHQIMNRRDNDSLLPNSPRHVHRMDATHNIPCRSDRHQGIRPLATKRIVFVKPTQISLVRRRLRRSKLRRGKFKIRRRERRIAFLAFDFSHAHFFRGACFKRATKLSGGPLLQTVRREGQSHFQPAQADECGTVFAHGGEVCYW